jgi:hypothetical protein
MLQVFGDLVRCEDPPDFRYECRQFSGKLGMLLGSLNEIEQFLPNQIIQCVLQPEALSDAFGGFALVDPDFVKLNG